MISQIQLYFLKFIISSVFLSGLISIKEKYWTGLKNIMILSILFIFFNFIYLEFLTLKRFF